MNFTNWIWSAVESKAWEALSYAWAPQDLNIAAVPFLQEPAQQEETASSYGPEDVEMTIENGADSFSVAMDTVALSEPMTLALIAIGMAGLVLARRFSRKKA